MNATDKTNPPPHEGSEQLIELAASLDADRVAADIEAAAINNAPPTITTNEAESWAFFPQIIGSLLVHIGYKELAPVYDEKSCLAWGHSMATVAKKYGWTAPASPEITLLTTTAMMVVPTVLAIKKTPLNQLASKKQTEKIDANDENKPSE